MVARAASIPGFGKLAELSAPGGALVALSKMLFDDDLLFLGKTMLKVIHQFIGGNVFCCRLLVLLTSLLEDTLLAIGWMSVLRKLDNLSCRSPDCQWHILAQREIGSVARTSFNPKLWFS